MSSLLAARLGCMKGTVTGATECALRPRTSGHAMLSRRLGILPDGGAEVVGRRDTVVGCLDLPREFVDLGTLEGPTML